MASSELVYNTLQVLNSDPNREFVAVPGAGFLFPEDHTVAKLAQAIPFRDAETATQEAIIRMRRELRTMAKHLDTNMKVCWKALGERDYLSKPDRDLDLNRSEITDFLCYLRRCVPRPEVQLKQLNSYFWKQLPKETGYSIDLIDKDKHFFAKLNFTNDMHILVDDIGMFPIDAFEAIAKSQKLDSDAQERMIMFSQKVSEMHREAVRREKSNNPLMWLFLGSSLKVEALHKTLWNLTDYVGGDRLELLSKIYHQHIQTRLWKKHHPYPEVLQPGQVLVGLRGQRYRLHQHYQNRLRNTEEWTIADENGAEIAGQALLKCSNPREGIEIYRKRFSLQSSEKVIDLVDRGWFFLVQQ